MVVKREQELRKYPKNHYSKGYQMSFTMEVKSKAFLFPFLYQKRQGRRCHEMSSSLHISLLKLIVVFSLSDLVRKHVMFLLIYDRYNI